MLANVGEARTVSDVDPNQYPPNGQPPPPHGEVPPGPNPTAEYPPGEVPPGQPSAGEPGKPPRRRRVLLAVAAAVVVIVGAGIGVAVSASGGDSTSSANPPGAPSSTTSGSPVTGNGQNGNGQNGKKGKNGKGQQQATRGTITAESGSTWTLKTDQGKTVKVTITADTKFGTIKAPASKTDFPVGKTVAVVAKPGTGTTTASRIRMFVANPKKPKSGGGSSPTPSSSPS